MYLNEHGIDVTDQIKQDLHIKDETIAGLKHIIKEQRLRIEELETNYLAVNHQLASLLVPSPGRVEGPCTPQHPAT